MKGYVYILTNHYISDLVKIGYTERDPARRAYELSNTTGVPGKWTVHTSWLLEDAYLWEQRLFSNLSKFRETGEFFRLSPQRAAEKVSALLASWGAIDSSGLSEAARREATKIRETCARENAQKEDAKRKWQDEQNLRMVSDNAIKFLQQVSKEIKKQEIIASNLHWEKWKPWFRRNCIKNALIWGISIFLVSLTFVKKQEGAFFLAAIAAFVAYGVGDNFHSDKFQIPHNKAKQDARNAVYQSQQLGFLVDKAKIAANYRHHMGFTIESIDNWERTGSPAYDIKFKNKNTGVCLNDKDIIYIEEVGYFDRAGARLFV